MIRRGDQNFSSFLQSVKREYQTMISSRVVIVLGLLAFVAVSHCQDFKATGVNEHNKYRAKHGGPNMSGDTKIHQSAQSWADYLAKNNKFEHSKGSGNGENIYKTWGGSKDLNQAVINACKSWYDEIKKYDFNKPGFSMGTGHFTQLVWKASTKLGIGAAIAPDAKYGHSITVVAQYNPPGNYEGQYPKNVVRPTS